MPGKYPPLSTKDQNGNYPEWYFDGRSLPLKIARFLGWLEDGCVELDPVTMTGYLAIFLGLIAIVRQMMTDPAGAIVSLGLFLGMIAAKGSVKTWQNSRAASEITRTVEHSDGQPDVVTTKESVQTGPGANADHRRGEIHV